MKIQIMRSLAIGLLSASPVFAGANTGATERPLVLDQPVINMVDETLNATEADPLKPVLDAYYTVKDALFASDGNAASAGATTLVAAIKAVKMEQLETKQHVAWMKVKKDLGADAEHIAETKDVGHQRDRFTALSDNLYKVIKVGKPSEAVYYQHCPMAKEGKGANWLSQVSTIKNPYFGAKMPNCGKTTETIK